VQQFPKEIHSNPQTKSQQVKWHQLAPETYRQRFILHTIWAFVSLATLGESLQHALIHRFFLWDGFKMGWAIIILFLYLRLLWNLCCNTQLRKRVLSDTPIPTIPKQATKLVASQSLLRPASPHAPEVLLRPTDEASEHLVRGSARPPDMQANEEQAFQ
jgi:hypothetical protein